MNTNIKKPLSSGTKRRRKKEKKKKIELKVILRNYNY